MPSISLLTLPDEAILEHILSFSLPGQEQDWEWIGVIGLTCREFRRVAQSLVPRRLSLADFEQYQSVVGRGNGEVIDARVSILQSLRTFDWKRQHLKELHVNWASVLQKYEDKYGQTQYSVDERILALLRLLITTSASFPELEWLDVELQCDHIFDYDLVNAESLGCMPRALPSLKKLCLCNCFKLGMSEVTPLRLKIFFNNLQTPLVSLSLGEILWMSDEHVATVLPIVGPNLIRLELAYCVVYDEDTEVETELTDGSMAAIAKFCTRLESFTITSANITAFGLERVLSTNPNIVKLNLSWNWMLRPTAVSIISQYLPKLRELRSYWPGRNEPWLTDESLAALVDEQERRSGGAGITLELIGLQSEDSLTSRGLQYAINKGVRVIEINEGNLHRSVCALKSNVALFQPQYSHYVDGSEYERVGVYC
ncbi:hypothetical protein ACHAWF_009149 [Thalassiosira exigua]